MKKEQLENLLRERNLKATSKRIILLDIIASKPSAVSKSTIQKELKSFDRVTLYRTLNALLTSGIIHIAHSDDHDVYYAMCKTCSHHEHRHNHIHFKCENCLEITCVEPLVNLYVEVPNYKINQLNVQATGVCAKCV